MQAPVLQQVRLCSCVAARWKQTTRAAGHVLQALNKWLNARACSLTQRLGSAQGIASALI
jgi:hypothetical protein